VPDIVFLSREVIMRLHGRSLAEHGGSDGLRDPAALESAIAQPQNDHHYGGADIFAVAASYAFHIAESQAFADGNKRTGISAALYYLEITGIETASASVDKLYDAMIAIARHELDKAGLAALFRELFA
jgi:death on curing protein